MAFEKLISSLEQKLLNAVQEENLDEVCELIQKGANVNKYSYGRTPLCVAAKLGNLPLLELLLDIGSSSPGGSPTQNSPHLASQDGGKSKSKRKKGNEGNNGYYVVVHSEGPPEDLNRNSVDEIMTPEGMDKLEWDPELEGQEFEDDSYSEDDVWSNQYKWYAHILERTCTTVVPPIIETKCDINLQDSIGRCPLHYAVEMGHIKAVNLLLSAGSRTDIGDLDSVTPLHLAASRGHTRIAEVLLAKGANVDARTVDKMTPLHYASTRDFPDTVELLVDKGANMNCLDSTDRTPLKLAASRGLTQVVQILVEKGAKVNIEDNKGYTALCEAVWQKSVPMVETLLQAGAKVKPTNYLVHYAVLHRHEPMIKLLVESGALINLRDALGQTPLITAALTDQFSVVEYLLDNGAAIDYFWESTPLSTYVASKRGILPSMVKLLVERGADTVRSEFHDAPLAMSVVVGKLNISATLISLGTNVDTKFTHPSYTGMDVMELAVQLATSYDLSTMLELMKIIWLAGYSLNKLNFIPKLDTPTKDPVMIFLREKKYSVMRLSELCRITVRRCSKEKVMTRFVKALPLPPPIKDYLLLMDEPLLAPRCYPSSPSHSDFYRDCPHRFDSPFRRDSDDSVSATKPCVFCRF